MMKKIKSLSRRLDKQPFFIKWLLIFMACILIGGFAVIGTINFMGLNSSQNKLPEIKQTDFSKNDQASQEKPSAPQAVQQIPETTSSSSSVIPSTSQEAPQDHSDASSSQTSVPSSSQIDPELQRQRDLETAQSIAQDYENQGYDVTIHE